VSEAREYYKRTQDADGALHRMPRYLTAERALLVSLKRDASNYLQAINCIPRTMRLMYDSARKQRSHFAIIAF
jgi:tRNA pseudouridine13 synthase